MDVPTTLTTECQHKKRAVGLINVYDFVSPDLEIETHLNVNVMIDFKRLDLATLN